jgi:hypothetical protein
LAKVVTVKVTTNNPAKAMDLTFFIVCSWWFERQGLHGRF